MQHLQIYTWVTQITILELHFTPQLEYALVEILYPMSTNEISKE